MNKKLINWINKYFPRNEPVRTPNIYRRWLAHSLLRLTIVRPDKRQFPKHIVKICLALPVRSDSVRQYRIVVWHQRWRWCSMRSRNPVDCPETVWYEPDSRRMVKSSDRNSSDDCLRAVHSRSERFPYALVFVRIQHRFVDRIILLPKFDTAKNGLIIRRMSFRRNLFGRNFLFAEVH